MATQLEPRQLHNVLRDRNILPDAGQKALKDRIMPREKSVIQDACGGLGGPFTQ